MSIDKATANSAEAESALAEPSTELDNPSNLDFEEPEEEQATQQTQETGTDSNRETDEAPESQEAEEPEAQTEQTDEEGKAKTETSAEPEDSITVSMPDGQKLELK